MLVKCSDFSKLQDPVAKRTGKNKRARSLGDY